MFPHNGSPADCLDRVQLLMNKVWTCCRTTDHQRIVWTEFSCWCKKWLKQCYVESSLQPFYCRHPELIDRYDIFILKGESILYLIYIYIFNFTCSITDKPFTGLHYTSSTGYLIRTGNCSSFATTWVNTRVLMVSMLPIFIFLCYVLFRLFVFVFFVLCSMLHVSGLSIYDCVVPLVFSTLYFPCKLLITSNYYKLFYLNLQEPYHLYVRIVLRSNVCWFLSHDQWASHLVE